MCSNSALGRRRLGEEDRRGADGEGEQQVRAGGVAEEELGHREGDVVLAVAQRRLGVELGGVGERAVGLDHRLGPAGGAAGEEPDRRIVAARGDVVEVRRQLAGDRLEAGVAAAGRRAADQELGAGAVFRGGFEGSHQVVPHHGAAGAAGAQQVGERIGLEGRVDHHHDRPELEDAEQGAGVLGPVGQGDEDPLLLTHAQAGESVGEAVGQPLDLAVGELAEGSAQGDPLAAALGDPAVEEVLGDVEVRRRLPGRLFSHGARSG